MTAPVHRRGVVVFVAPGFSEPGGCASHGRKIAEGLAQRGWTVHVIAQLASGTRLHRRRGPGLYVTEIPGFGRQRSGGLLFLLFGLPLALLRKRPAALMAMQLSSPAMVASVAAALFRRRLLVFSTSTGPHGEVAFVRASRLRRFRCALLSRASTLIAQTEQGANELLGTRPGGDCGDSPEPSTSSSVSTSTHGQPLSYTPEGSCARRISARCSQRGWE